MAYQNEDTIMFYALYYASFTQEDGVLDSKFVGIYHSYAKAKQDMVKDIEENAKLNNVDDDKIIISDFSAKFEVIDEYCIEYSIEKVESIQ
jgi:hypothetical protein